MHACSLSSLLLPRFALATPLLFRVPRADALAPLLQAGDKPKKTPGQPKTRKGGKSRMNRPMDDLLEDPTLPGDPNYVADEQEFSEEPVTLTVVSLGNSPVRIGAR